MVRLLYGLGVLALVGAGVVFALCLRQWSRDDPTSQWLADQPGASERFRRQVEKDAGAKPKASPLVTQAEVLAKLLAPPPAPKKKEPRAPEKAVVKAEPVPTRVPAAEISPKFKLRGTSYCSWHPERSMALIVEPGAKDGGRWVRQGAQIGHFVIHQIRPSSVLCQAGERVCKLAVEREAAPATVVAGSARPVGPAPRTMAKGGGRPTEAGPSGRPGPRSGVTVGSARSAALD
jgi:hypothetical protein